MIQIARMPKDFKRHSKLHMLRSVYNHVLVSLSLVISIIALIVTSTWQQESS